MDTIELIEELQTALRRHTAGTKSLEVSVADILEVLEDEWKAENGIEEDDDIFDEGKEPW